MHEDVKDRGNVLVGYDENAPRSAPKIQELERSTTHLPIYPENAVDDAFLVDLQLAVEGV